MALGRRISKSTRKEISKWNLKQRFKKVLDKARVYINADGGDVELVDVTEDGIVKVRLTGACHGCPMASITLKDGIEQMMKDELPEIVEVQSVQ